MTQTPSFKTQTLEIGGMDCGSCAKTIEVGLQQLSGITEVKVNFTIGKARVSYNPKVLSEKTIYDRIKDLGYTVEQSHERQSHQHIHTHSSGSEHDHDRQNHHHNVDVTPVKMLQLNLVEQAQGSRAPSQQWVDKFAEVYTPSVILIAIAIALIPTLAFAKSFNVWLYRALVMLVIVCPCALVISTPVFED
jgi:Cd2+/Zn2+-exporting ATPase